MDTSPNNRFLRLENVEKVFSGPDGEVRAVDGVSLDLDSGEFISIVGPSGCGKTTLLNMVAGLESVTAGQLTLNGNLINSPVTDVGIVFQDATLMEWRTVLENVMLQIEVRKLKPRDYVDRALTLIDGLGLSQFRNSYPSQLSGGMKQRVSIARALVHKPSLLLMDEPFSALDALTRDKLNLDIQDLCIREGTTTLFITHSVMDAVFLADRVVVMTPRPGKIDKIIDIDMEKPRKLSVRENNQFGEYSGEIRMVFEKAGIL